jgi:hypothetical protein
LRTSNLTLRMPSSGMLRSVAPVSIELSEKLSASIIRVTRIGELGRWLLVRLKFLVHLFLSP